MFLRTFVILVFCVLQLSAQELPPRTVSIIGSAEQLLLADKVSFDFSVVGHGSTLRMAVDDAKSKTDKILKSLTSLGIPQSSFQTEEFTSGENWDKAFLSSSRDFKTTVKTEVTLDSLELLESVVLAISDHKPESISNIAFQLSDFEKQRREIQIAAVLDAKLQANKIAKELGVEIKNPYVVEAWRDEGSLRSTPMPMLYARGGRAGEVSYSVDGSGPQSLIGVKKILVKEVVRIVFQY